MAKKTKHNIDIIVQIDNKEKDLYYVNDIKLDKRRNKDGVKVLSTERCNVKPNTRLGTCDVSFKYKFEDSDEWIQSSFGCELKKKTDLFSSVYMKANRERLFREIDRCVEAEVDMYFIATDDITAMRKGIEKIRKFNDYTCITFLDNLMKLKTYLMLYNIPYFTSGNDLGWLIRRLIKLHIKKTKINYK